MGLYIAKPRTCFTQPLFNGVFLIRLTGVDQYKFSSVLYEYAPVEDIKFTEDEMFAVFEKNIDNETIERHIRKSFTKYCEW